MQCSVIMASEGENLCGSPILPPKGVPLRATQTPRGAATCFGNTREANEQDLTDDSTQWLPTKPTCALIQHVLILASLVQIVTENQSPICH